MTQPAPAIIIPHLWSVTSDARRRIMRKIPGKFVDLLVLIGADLSITGSRIKQDIYPKVKCTDPAPDFVLIGSLRGRKCDHKRAGTGDQDKSKHQYSHYQSGDVTDQSESEGVNYIQMSCRAHLNQCGMRLWHCGSLVLVSV